MGFWDWVFPLGDDQYLAWAGKEFDKIKNRCGVTADDRRAEAVGAALVERIRMVYKQGGETCYRDALALWQLANAVYPEHVTVEDYPQFVPCLYDLPFSDTLLNHQWTEQATP